MYIEDYNDDNLLAQAQQLIKAQQSFSEMPEILSTDDERLARLARLHKVDLDDDFRDTVAYWDEQLG